MAENVEDICKEKEAVNSKEPDTELADGRPGQHLVRTPGQLTPLRSARGRDVTINLQSAR